MDHEHVYILKGDFDQLVASVAQLQAQFKAMEQRADAAEKQVQKLTEAKKKGAGAAKQHGDAVAGLEKVLKTFGGTVAGTTDTVFDLFEGLGKMGAAASVGGVAVGGLVVTLGAATAATAALASASADATERLVKQGLASELPPGAVESVQEYRLASEELWRSVDLVTAEFGGPFVEAATTAMLAVAGVANAVQQGSDYLWTYWSAATNVAWALSHLAPQGWLADAAVAAVAEVSSLAAESGRDMAEAHHETARAAKEAEEAAKKLTAAERDLTEAQRERKKINEENAEQAEFEKQIYLQLGLVYDDTGERAKASGNEQTKAAKERARLIAENERDLVKAAEVESAAQRQVMLDWVETGLAADAAVTEWTTSMQDGIANLALAVDTTLAPAFDAAMEQWQADMQSGLDDLGKATDEAMEDMKEARKEFFSATADVAVQIGQSVAGAFEELHQLEVDRLQSELDGLTKKRDALREVAAQERADDGDASQRTKNRLADIDAQMKAQRQALLDAFETQQNAARASAIMDAAAAAMAMLPAFAYLGPGAPFAVAAVVGPMLAANLVKIDKQEPPVRHDGGLAPDELMAGGMVLRDGEASVVFNERAVERGALDVADALNRGMPGAGAAGGGRELVLADAGRAVARAWLREVERPESRLSLAVGSTTGQVELGGRL